MAHKWPRVWMPSLSAICGNRVERTEPRWIEFCYSTFDVWPELLELINARKAAREIKAKRNPRANGSGG